jgi:hypothetical protein
VIISVIGRQAAVDNPEILSAMLLPGAMAREAVNIARCKVLLKAPCETAQQLLTSDNFTSAALKRGTLVEAYRLTASPRLD